MIIYNARNQQHAEQLLSSGIKKVALAWNIERDDFFNLASDWCEKGATISRDSGHFIISQKGFVIPPND